MFVDDFMKEVLVKRLTYDNSIYLCHTVPEFQEHWNKWRKENSVELETIHGWMDVFDIDIDVGSNLFRKFLVESWVCKSVFECTYEEWYDEMIRCTELFKEKCNER